MMCKYCEQKIKLNDDNYFSAWDNEIKLIDGGWTTLFIGINEKNQIVLRACGDNYTDDFVINYCPICGRKLKKEVPEND